MHFRTKVIQSVLKKSMSYNKIFGNRRFSNVLQDIYNNQVSNCVVNYDKRQYKLIKLFDKVKDILEKRLNSENLHENRQKGIYMNSENLHENRQKGIYIYGDVGTGKTWIMDLFYYNCNIPKEKKRRVHFHKFMLEIHESIHKMDTEDQTDGDDRDKITKVADMIASTTCLLCFDEFQVTDIFDAMILLRLFRIFWSRGVVLIATSNRKPADLYQNGLNRQYFLPFIDQIQKECIVYDIGGEVDYRLLTNNDIITTNVSSFMYPLNQHTAQLLQKSFESETLKNIQFDLSVPVAMNRQFVVSKGCLQSRVCWIDFDDLCVKDRAAADYQAITTHFNTVYVSKIPRFNVFKYDVARRFIIFIDEMYNAQARLVCTASDRPESLFAALQSLDQPIVNEDESIMNHSIFSMDTAIRGDNTSTNAVRRTVPLEEGQVGQEEHIAELLQGELASIKELQFAFKRAVSRLTEMSGPQYLQRWLLANNDNNG